MGMLTKRGNAAQEIPVCFLLCLYTQDQAPETEKQQVFFQLLKDVFEEFYQSTFAQRSTDKVKVPLKKEDNKALRDIWQAIDELRYQHCEDIE